MSVLRKVKPLLSQSLIGDIYRFISTRARTFISPRARAKRHLRASIACFKKEYDAYWANISSDRSKTTNTGWYDEILQNGFTIIPDYLSKEEVNAIRSEVWSLPGFIEGQYVGGLKFFPRPVDGICALSISKQLPMAHKVTIDNRELHTLAQALFGSSARLSAASVLNKYDASKVDSAEVPHWDDWRVRLKAFIYLTDVGEDNAPTLFLRGSTRGVPWRLEKDYASVFLPQASAGGSWHPIEPLGFERVMCTGKAGTMVVFDARGIHAATQLRKGIRVMLMSMYATHLDFTDRVY